MSDNDARYQDILRRIAQRKNKPPPPTSDLEQILDALNTLDVMRDAYRRQTTDFLCYGPRSFKQDNWASVVIWYRQKGYHGYQTLYLFGIWIVRANQQYEVIIGRRDLSYAAPVYVAEAYHQLIRKGFKVYYDDSGTPPTESDTRHYRVIYDPTKRLAIRQEVEHYVQSWAREL